MEIIIKNRQLHESYTIYQDPPSGAYFHLFTDPGFNGRGTVRRYGLKKLDGEVILPPVFTAINRLPQRVEDSSSLRFITYVYGVGFNVVDSEGDRLFDYEQQFIAPAEPGYMVVTPPSGDTTFVCRANGETLKKPQLSLLIKSLELRDPDKVNVYSFRIGERKYEGLVDSSGRFIYPVRFPPFKIEYVDPRCLNTAAGFTASGYNRRAELLDSSGRVVWESDSFGIEKVYPGSLVVKEFAGFRQAIISTVGDTILGLGPWNGIRRSFQNYSYEVWRYSGFGGSGTRRYGMVNGQGEEILPPVYKNISVVYGHEIFAVTDSSGRMGLLSSSGDILMPCRCDGAGIITLRSQKLYACRTDGSIQLFTTDGKPVLPRLAYDVQFLPLLDVLLVKNSRQRYKVYTADGRRSSRRRFVGVSARPLSEIQKKFSEDYPLRARSVGIWAVDENGKEFVINARGKVISQEKFFTR